MDKVIKALLNTKRSAEAGSSAERLQKVDIRVQGAMLRINVPKQQLPSVIPLQRPEIRPYQALTSIWMPFTRVSAQDSAQVTLLPYLAISAHLALLRDVAPSDQFILDF